MKTNETEIEFESELAEWDDGIKRDASHSQNMKYLYEAKKAVKAIQEKREAVSIPIQGGMILTTCPEKWEQHNKAYLRGNAVKEVKQ